MFSTYTDQRTRRRLTRSGRVARTPRDVDSTSSPRVPRRRGIQSARCFQKACGERDRQANRRRQATRAIPRTYSVRFPAIPSFHVPATPRTEARKKSSLRGILRREAPGPNRKRCQRPASPPRLPPKGSVTIVAISIRSHRASRFGTCGDAPDYVAEPPSNVLHTSLVPALPADGPQKACLEPHARG